MRGSVNKEKYIKVPSTTVIRYRLFIVPKLRNKRSANVAKQLKLRRSGVAIKGTSGMRSF